MLGGAGEAVIAAGGAASTVISGATAVSAFIRDYHHNLADDGQLANILEPLTQTLMTIAARAADEEQDETLAMPIGLMFNHVNALNNVLEGFGGQNRFSQAMNVTVNKETFERLKIALVLGFVHLQLALNGYALRQGEQQYSDVMGKLTGIHAALDTQSTQTEQTLQGITQQLNHVIDVLNKHKTANTSELPHYEIKGDAKGGVFFARYVAMGSAKAISALQTPDTNSTPSQGFSGHGSGSGKVVFAERMDITDDDPKEEEGSRPKPK